MVYHNLFTNLLKYLIELNFDMWYNIITIKRKELIKMIEVYGIYERYGRSESDIFLIKIFKDEEEAIDYMRKNNYYIETNPFIGEIYHLMRKKIILY